MGAAAGPGGSFTSPCGRGAAPGAGDCTPPGAEKTESPEGSGAADDRPRPEGSCSTSSPMRARGPSCRRPGGNGCPVTGAAPARVPDGCGPCSARASRLHGGDRSAGTGQSGHSQFGHGQFGHGKHGPVRNINPSMRTKRIISLVPAYRLHGKMASGTRNSRKAVFYSAFRTARRLQPRALSAGGCSPSGTA